MSAVRVSTGALIWGAACLAAIVPTVAINLDRAAEHSEVLAQVVPAPARSNSLPALVQGAMNSGDYDRALALARTNVSRNPVPSENLSLLALVLMKKQDIQGANMALLASAGRGWRDPVAQLFVVQVAMANGEVEMATDRLRALWRVGGDRTATLAAAQTILADPRGVATVQAWLAANAEDADGFLRWGMNNLDLTQVAEVAAGASAKGAVLSCETVGTLALKALGQGRADSAWRVWKAGCEGDRSLGLERELAFSVGGARANSNPYGWELAQRTGLTTTLSGEGANASISYVNRNLQPTVAGVRYARLAPGEYGISYAGELIASQPPIVWIDCISSEGQEDTSLGRVPLIDGGAARVTIPETCRTQRIRLLFQQGKGNDVVLKLTV